MKNIIPGHVRAFTWLLALVTAVVAYFISDDWYAVLGILLVVKGAFLGDQATHLAQEDHSALPPTWIERMQQKHRLVFVILGLILAGLGVFLMLRQ
jgi:hypothetical protein